MATSLPVLEEVVAGLSITVSERAATVSGIVWGGVSARHSQGGLLVMKLNVNAFERIRTPGSASACRARSFIVKARWGPQGPYKELRNLVGALRAL